MKKDQAYNLFEEMIAEADKTLRNFTLHQDLNLEHKADKTVVTACDKKISDVVSPIAENARLQVLSEEGEYSYDILHSGNYISIDPIDGTLCYIEYVNYALEHGGIQNFLKKDLGPAHDFSILFGIVENNVPQYGACYNYITKETIFIDGNNKNNLIWRNKKRDYSKQKYAVYTDSRPGGKIEKELVAMKDTSVNKQMAVGIRSLYLLLNPHDAAITVHTAQTAGLWDILPAAVAARAFGGEVYDDQGNLLQLNKYMILPGNGTTVLRGDKFRFILEKLKDKKH